MIFLSNISNATPVISTEAEKRMFSGTKSMDVSTRPSLYTTKSLRCNFLTAIIPFSFFLFSFFISSAQPRENKKIKFMAKVETRNSFVQTHYASFLGVRAGFEFKFPIRCGLGYYWMWTKLDSKFYKPGDFGQTDMKAQPKMRYAMGYIDYSFYEEDDWTLSVPVQIGIGETYYRSETKNRFANGLIIPMEAGIAVDYLFTRWLGFGVGLGYRVMLKNNKQIKENFNSPYYQVRFNIAFSEMFRAIQNKATER